MPMTMLAANPPQVEGLAHLPSSKLMTRQNFETGKSHIKHAEAFCIGQQNSWRCESTREPIRSVFVFHDNANALNFSPLASSASNDILGS